MLDAVNEDGAGMIINPIQDPVIAHADAMALIGTRLDGAVWSGMLRERLQSVGETYHDRPVEVVEISLG